MFVQDKWQARSNVTVDLGLRWEYYNPLQGVEGKGTLAELRSGDEHHPGGGLWRTTTPST